MKLKHYTIAGLFALGAALPAMSSAAGDAAAGKAKASSVCSACHGSNGLASIPTYPNLAGQNEQYLVSALKAYKNKQRSGGQAAVMQAQAQALSDEDIANLAAYFSSLPADGGK
ncbi:MAG TPA: cytochrome C [Marinobacter sp.]|jgi:cytochrome c553|nr:c-type cytochrome [Pseudomonadota bacterium]HCW91225.1 cytochrome C [Marinobacter sp.]